jgi:hypothetical protein
MVIIVFCWQSPPRSPLAEEIMAFQSFAEPTLSFLLGQALGKEETGGNFKIQSAKAREALKKLLKG